MTKEQLAALQTDELITEYEKAARILSFFNAGEGESYRREATERAAARKHLSDVAEAIVERGEHLPVGNWLI